MRSVLIIFLMFISFAGLSGVAVWWITGPERSAQKNAPHGLRVVVVDLPGDPNIVRYDPVLISSKQLLAFGRAQCGATPVITGMSPTLFDKLRAHQRASFVCG